MADYRKDTHPQVKAARTTATGHIIGHVISGFVSILLFFMGINIGTGNSSGKVIDEQPADSPVANVQYETGYADGYRDGQAEYIETEPIGTDSNSYQKGFDDGYEQAKSEIETGNQSANGKGSALDAMVNGVSKVWLENIPMISYVADVSYAKMTEIETVIFDTTDKLYTHGYVMHTPTIGNGEKGQRAEFYLNYEYETFDYSLAIQKDSITLESGFLFLIYLDDVPVVEQTITNGFVIDGMPTIDVSETSVLK